MNNNSWSELTPIYYIWEKQENLEQFGVLKKLRSQDANLGVFSQALRILNMTPFLDCVLLRTQRWSENDCSRGLELAQAKVITLWTCIISLSIVLKF